MSAPPQPRVRSSLAPATPPKTVELSSAPPLSLSTEFRAFLFPERRWHWVFHLFVMLVSASYWLISAAVTRDGLRSMAETVLYRPGGDGQYWPVVTAMSQFNFGDPTDFANYGQGLLSVPIAPLLPYALAQALFGLPGYAVADVVLSLMYAAAVFLFFRVCGASRLVSLALGMALATGLLQKLADYLASAFVMVLGTTGYVVAEQAFPNLLELTLQLKRIPRPMVTEIWVVLLMTTLLRLWLAPQRSTFTYGGALGVLMGLLVQGDFYSLNILGLMLLAVGVVILREAGCKKLAHLASGLALGAMLVGWVFILQRWQEHPDVPRRLGLVPYDRTQWMFLPGFAPWLRLGVIVVVAGLSFWGTGAGTPGRRWWNWHPNFSVWTVRLALFLSLLMLAACLAQPIQVFLLGKGAQLYHYLHAVPIFYGYALLVLLYHVARRTAPPELHQLSLRLAGAPGKTGAIVLALALGCGFMLAVEKPIKRIYEEGTVREASVDYEPWGKFGKNYRANLTKIDRAFLQIPPLQQARTIATLNLDVYVLLTAFHDKRSFLPDSSMTVLRDEDIEERLCLFGTLLDLTSHEFLDLLQFEHVKNYFLGANKYRFSDDYQFASDLAEYNPILVNKYIKHPIYRQWGWILAVPKSELVRITRRYLEIRSMPINPAIYPDLIILDVNEVESGLKPRNDLYRLLATNSVFCVFQKQLTP